MKLIVYEGFRTKSLKRLLRWDKLYKSYCKITSSSFWVILLMGSWGYGVFQKNHSNFESPLLYEHFKLKLNI